MLASVVLAFHLPSQWNDDQIITDIAGTNQPFQIRHQPFGASQQYQEAEAEVGASHDPMLTILESFGIYGSCLGPSEELDHQFTADGSIGAAVMPHSVFAAGH
jgi:hypothetical protein